MTPLSEADRADLLPALDGWALAEGEDALTKRFTFGSFVEAFGWMTRVALVAEAVLIAALLVLAVMTLGREGLPSLDTFSLAGADWWQILVGATIVMGVTIGFEASAALARICQRR